MKIVLKYLTRPRTFRVVTLGVALSCLPFTYADEDGSNQQGVNDILKQKAEGFGQKRTMPENEESAKDQSRWLKSVIDGRIKHMSVSQRYSIIYSSILNLRMRAEQLGATSMAGKLKSLENSMELAIKKDEQEKQMAYEKAMKEHDEIVKKRKESLPK
ncbi:MAG: hypothetical protein HYV97_06755 [Bdellovibrio sp.]|nr:hypothetical protein [Bdellovibrio sp.]